MNNSCFSFRKIHFKLDGLSLAELLISVTLIGLILLVAGSVDIASRRFFSRAEKGIVALNDITLALEYIGKSAQRAIGDVGNPAVYYNPAACGAVAGFKLRIDTDSNGIADATDGFHTFCFGLPASENITFTDQIGTDNIICRHLASSPTINGATPGQIRIGLTGRDNPAAIESIDNPNVHIETTVFFRSASLQ
ncbi:MAG: hypothetical protein FJZ10_02630 [Candidatus Omnitrophica bacterium]|nr:hypothetical protein [Candidatus Omnitrophota bacterium]